MKSIVATIVLFAVAGRLNAGIESPVVSLDKPLPSEALSLARPASGTDEPVTSETNMLHSANLSAADSKSLWAALSEARREICESAEADAVYKQWGKQNFFDPAWTDLGTPGTPCSPGTPYRFFKITDQ